MPNGEINLILPTVENPKKATSFAAINAFVIGATMKQSFRSWAVEDLLEKRLFHGRANSKQLTLMPPHSPATVSVRSETLSHKSSTEREIFHQGEKTASMVSTLGFGGEIQVGSSMFPRRSLRISINRSRDGGGGPRSFTTRRPPSRKTFITFLDKGHRSRKTLDRVNSLPDCINPLPGMFFLFVHRETTPHSRDTYRIPSKIALDLGSGLDHCLV